MTLNDKLKQEILDSWLESLFPKTKYPKVTWEKYKANEYAGVGPLEIEKIVGFTIQKLTNHYQQKIDSILKSKQILNESYILKSQHNQEIQKIFQEIEQKSWKIENPAYPREYRRVIFESDYQKIKEPKK